MGKDRKGAGGGPRGWPEDVRSQAGKVRNLFGRGGGRGEGGKRVVEAREKECRQELEPGEPDSRIGRWGGRPMSESQMRVLRKAIGGYQPERKEARTVRLLEFRGLVRTTSFGFPSIVETTDEGRIRLGLKPRQARRAKPMLRIVQGGKS